MASAVLSTGSVVLAIGIAMQDRSGTRVVHLCAPETLVTKKASVVPSVALVA
jgi:hypothetical protein